MVIYNSESNKLSEIDNKPSIPDYVTQTRAWLEANPSRIQEALPLLMKKTDLKSLVVNYVIEHPNSIPEIINEQYPDLREKLNGLGVLEQAGLDMAKAKFPPLGFLIDAIKEGKVESIDGDVSLSDLTQGGKFDAGHENIPLDGQRQEEQPESNPEDFMTTEIQIEIIERMAELSEEGLSLPEIQDAIWREYQVEYHPLKIKRMLKAFYAKPEKEELEDDNSQQPNPAHASALKKIANVLEENSKLKSEKAERERIQAIDKIVDEKVNAILKQANPNPHPAPERIGLVRKLWKALY